MGWDPRVGAHGLGHMPMGWDPWVGTGDKNRKSSISFSLGRFGTCEYHHPFRVKILDRLQDFFPEKIRNENFEDFVCVTICWKKIRVDEKFSIEKNLIQFFFVTLSNIRLGKIWGTFIFYFFEC